LTFASKTHAFGLSSVAPFVDVVAELFGGDGSDTLNMTLGRGYADRENGGDICHADTILQSTIQDGPVGKILSFVGKFATM
jgi:hypothetical protein